ncbi:hypothetical protein [Parachlamydia sp. AcF125]|uniref:hypothetical protein n=1 Tax=Parachlamydia sp. AcF125 TaxID=2795736 RepID=UPI001BC8FCB2|nr:hypothetical protein [Parachlamydia sp. AcF125]MBS4167619.1 hypothetical protein [Parachlamydia sp. AcF125]
MGVDLLKAEIFREIVGPYLEEKTVKEKATSLGISEIKSLEEKNLLINSLAQEILAKISDYLKKKEVFEKYKHLQYYNSSSPYKWCVLEQTEKAVETIYPYSADENLLSNTSSKQTLDKLYPIGGALLLCSAVAMAIFSKME